MRRVLLLAALAAGGSVAAPERACAQSTHFGPSATSVTWPSVTPPGWYTNTYNHAWYYPWYAYYNHSHGTYANWMMGGGFATYAHAGPAGHFYYPREVAQPYLGAWYRGDGQSAAPASTPNPGKDKKDEKKDEKKGDKNNEKKDEKGEGRVSVTLPSDARLLFNGAPAPGSGNVRVFRTPELVPGVSYRYEVTAEVVRDGRIERTMETVTVRAGETAMVALNPGVTAASK